MTAPTVGMTLQRDGVTFTVTRIRPASRTILLQMTHPPYRQRQITFDDLHKYTPVPITPLRPDPAP